MVTGLKVVFEECLTGLEVVSEDSIAITVLSIVYESVIIIIYGMDIQSVNCSSVSGRFKPPSHLVPLVLRIALRVNRGYFRRRWN